MDDPLSLLTTQTAPLCRSERFSNTPKLPVSGPPGSATKLQGQNNHESGGSPDDDLIQSKLDNSTNLFVLEMVFQTFQMN
jgi:hypothetical protein